MEEKILKKKKYGMLVLILSILIYAGAIATAIIGGMLAYPIATLFMNKEAAIFTFVVPFLISTCGGTVIAAIITIALEQAGLLKKLKTDLEG